MTSPSDAHEAAGLQFPNKTRSHCLLRIALVAALIASSAFAFYLKQGDLFVGFDGGYMRNLAQRQFEWGLPLFTTSMDWFQGLGDVFFPDNFRLLPAFIAAAPFGSGAGAKIISYVLIFCELSVATVLFGISLGAHRIVAIAAALVTCIGLFPFFHATLLYGILGLAPQVGSLIAAALIIAAAFLRYGKRNWLADLPFAGVVVALVVWSILVSITAFMLAIPFLLLCAFSGTIASATSAERWCKIGLLAVACLVFICGPAIYFAGTIADTAAVIFPLELANNRASFYFASILFQWHSAGPLGPILVVMAVGGAIFTALDTKHRTLRIFAITLLTYLGTRLTFSILVIVFDFWRGPSPLYFEFYVIPLYAVFAVLFCVRIRENLGRVVALYRPENFTVEAVLLAAGSVTIVLLALSRPQEDYGLYFPYPPAPTPITDILKQETGLVPGEVFRGRTANMTGRAIDHDINWFDLHGLDGVLSLNVGNEMRLAGLHYFGVPGLFEYTSTISPYLFAIASRLLARPDDGQMRSVLVTRTLDPRILAMLGVRFVITDLEYDGPAQLRATMPTKNRTLFLYEIATPNVGSYSPTTVVSVGNASDIIARLRDPSFDPQRDVIGAVPDSARGFVPAHNARLSFLGGSLRIEAESDGRSILLLPLEFSRCLQASAGKYDKPLLFRANLLETGVLFNRQLDTILQLRTGAFFHPECRLSDFFDARALHVGEIPKE